MLLDISSFNITPLVIAFITDGISISVLRSCQYSLG